MIKITKKGNKAWVTFTLEAMQADAAPSICGEWSDWQEEPLKQKKNGDFYITKVIPCAQNYQFGFKTPQGWIIDESVTCVESPFGSKNSLLEL